jgi:pimeloyl-ACP methyl ester carboxylesterase
MLRAPTSTNDAHPEPAMPHALHTLDVGSGTPVVLLHSGGMSSRQWKKLADVVSTTHRVLAPDFLGSGQNPLWPSDVPFSFGLDVDAIVELVENLHTPVHLVGHSYGGFVATCVARRVPQAVRSLSLYDPVAFGVLYDVRDDEGLRDLERAGENPLFVDEERGGGDAWFEVFVDYWNGPGSWRALPPPARESFLRVGRKVFFEVLSLMPDRTGADAYAHIAAPALLMTGTTSPPAAQRVAALLAQAFVHGRVQHVEGAGHMGPITHAHVVNGLIAAHITSVDAAAR